MSKEANVHFFSVDLATEIGIEEAILYQNINFWVKHNKANNNNCYDEEYWTYNSAKAFQELFPYMSEYKINRSLNRLEELGYIKSGNYNKMKYDRTKWYTTTCKLQNQEMHFAKSKMEVSKIKNGSIENARPIPDVNADNKTDVKTYTSDFEELWEMYPLKKGKGRIAGNETKLKRISNMKEEMKRCIERYVKYVEMRKSTDFPEMHFMNGSTFFNSGYLDYTDENYDPVDYQKPKQKRDKDGNYIDEYGNIDLSKGRKLPGLIEG